MERADSSRQARAALEASRQSSAQRRNSEGEEVSEEAFGQSRIRVCNARGHLCHISCEAIVNCTPETLFAILTNPDNSRVFRDIKKVGYRKVVTDDPDGVRVIEVEQLGEIKLLWHKHTFSTLLTVTEDRRNGYQVIFDLIKSDTLSKFSGSWNLQKGQPTGAGGATTKAILEQDILPVGVPPFMCHVPVVGPVLRTICVRAVRRLLEDVQAVIKKAQSGTPLEKILQPAASRQPAAKLRPGESRSRVASHVIPDLNEKVN